MPSPGRNDPCPCGSGRKHKRCCGTAGGPLDVAASLHALDEDLVARILRCAHGAFPADLREAIEGGPLDPDDEAAQTIFGAYLAYLAPMGGRTAASTFLVREGGRLTPRERDWLEANGRAWLSVWEVVDVYPQRGLHLRDLLTGEQRGVTERLGTRGMRPRMAICGRVVDMATVSLIVGMHGRPLDPLAAERIVGRVRRLLRVRDGLVLPSRLRSGFAVELLDLWQDAVEALDARPMPRLQNTDGDPLQETVDHFSLEGGARREVEAILAKLGGFAIADLPDEDLPEATVFRVVRPGKAAHGSLEDVSMGTVSIDPSRVRVCTNSERRGDALRARVEAACGRLLRHERRERRDLQDVLASEEPRPRRDEPPGMDPAVGDALVLAFKRKHYASWPDEPLPILGGLTPRQAAARPSSRRTLVALLEDMDLHEAAEDPGRRFDFEALRRELGVGEA